MKPINNLRQVGPGKRRGGAKLPPVKDHPDFYWGMRQNESLTPTFEGGADTLTPTVSRSPIHLQDQQNRIKHYLKLQLPHPSYYINMMEQVAKENTRKKQVALIPQI